MELCREYLPLSNLGLPLGDLNKANQSCLQTPGPAIASERTFHGYRVVPTLPRSPHTPVLDRDSNEGHPTGKRVT